MKNCNFQVIQVFRMHEPEVCKQLDEKYSPTRVDASGWCGIFNPSSPQKQDLELKASTEIKGASFLQQNIIQVLKQFTVQNSTERKGQQAWLYMLHPSLQNIIQVLKWFTVQNSPEREGQQAWLYMLHPFLIIYSRLTKIRGQNFTRFYILKEYLVVGLVIFN